MKIIQIMTIAILGIWSLSCTSDRDDLWIYSDGSCKYVSTTDMSNFYPMLLMGLEAESEDAEDDEFKTLLTGLIGQEKADTTWQLRSMFEMMAKDEEGDPIVKMFEEMENDLGEDSSWTEEDKEGFKRFFNFLLDLKIRVQVDKSENKLIVSNIKEFSSLEEIDQLTKDLLKISELVQREEERKNKEEGEEGFSFDQTAYLSQVFGGMPAFEVDGKYFRYKSQGLDMSKIMGEETNEMSAMMNMFSDDDKIHQLYIHLPGKIKRINSDKVKKIDKQTILIETPLKDMYDPEKSLDLEVKFKPKKNKKKS